MTAKDFLKSKKIWLGTKISDMNAPENYFDLENLLEDYHQAKLELHQPNVISSVCEHKWEHYLPEYEIQICKKCISLRFTE
jgi:hypothetical protein